MDAPCEIQGSIHVFRLVNNMCPGKWVHITSSSFFLYKIVTLEKAPLPRGSTISGKADYCFH